MASKEQDLKAQQERCIAKDQELAELAQRIEQLESAAEARQQAETACQVQQSHDWAVNVSLNQGMGEGHAPMMPNSPRALRQRVLVLEVCPTHSSITIAFADTLSYLIFQHKTLMSALPHHSDCMRHALGEMRHLCKLKVWQACCNPHTGVSSVVFKITE